METQNYGNLNGILPWVSAASVATVIANECCPIGATHINSITLMKWLRSPSVMAKELALAFKAQHHLDVKDWRHQELILSSLHGKLPGAGRMATLSCKALSSSFSKILSSKELCHSEERQLVHELKPHFAKTSEETHTFDRMMDGSRSNDTVEHMHMLLEEHLGAPATVGPALKGSSNIAISGLAFPSLFPLGTGHYENPRQVNMQWYQWARALVRFHDGRFATHSTFPYFLLNTLQRQQSFDNASLFMQRDMRFDRKTWDDLEKLSHQDKVKTFKKVSAAAANTQNSDGYWQKQKLDLLAAVDQLGDPTFFMTNSHADTHCPYLAQYIKVHAQIEGGGVDDPDHPSFSDDAKTAVKIANVVKYPHLVAEFFHLKTELMLAYVGSTMGALAHWCRYEWQMRGSTHVHYFLWCKDAPQLHFLDDWVTDVVDNLGWRDEPITEELGQELVDALNQHSNAQCSQPGEAQQAIGFYTNLCSRWNNSWDSEGDCPVKLHDKHASKTWHVPMAQGATAISQQLLQSVQEDRAAILNDTGRHVPHNVNYCMKRAPDNTIYCRFHYPQDIKQPNTPHFRAKMAGGGVMWELYFPINDPFMLITNAEQSASQRSNVDCKPLVGHHACVQYVCKYATKLESASQTFNTSMARALSGFHWQGDDGATGEGGDGGGPTEGDTNGPIRDTKTKPSRDVYSSFLMQQNGARNWSSQEVAHVLMGIPSTTSSHKFRSFSTSNWNKLKQRDTNGNVDEFGDALEANKWEKYLDRMSTMWSMVADLDTTQRTIYGQLPMDQQEWVAHIRFCNMLCSNMCACRLARMAADVSQCSFIDFWSKYKFSSDGRPKKNASKDKTRNQIEHITEPMVVVPKPSVALSWSKPGHCCRPWYCECMLKRHKPFLCKHGYLDYMAGHQDDFEAAFEEFANSSGAPAVVKDAFARYNKEEPSMGDPDAPSDGGESIHEKTWAEDVDHIFQNINPEFTNAHQASQEANFDWVAHTANNYTDALVAEAGKWMQVASHADGERQPIRVDPATLNADQAFIYRSVLEHDARWERRTPHQPCQPYLAMINGTAGSGKTYLIHAIMDALEGRAVAVAPTGVAADNINGQTYHSLLKTPIRAQDRKNTAIINPSKQKHLNKVFRENSPKVEYVILDEMSMIGKTSLGHIEKMMRHATGKEEMFGGLNVILLGDHGQLPPVSDGRCYSWDSCKHKKNSPHCRCTDNTCGAVHRGDWKDTCTHWHRKGLEAYEHITNSGHVFYLTTIQRCSGSDDLSQEFREVQMAARGGTLTQKEHDWLYQHCSIKAHQTRGTLGEFESATRLVATRKLRDQVNAADMEQLIRNGAPSIVVKAMDSDTQWLTLKEDEKRLHDELALAIGQNVMVNWNLTVKHGLVNGTRGVVAEVLVNAKNIPVAVILAVKKGGDGHPGYSGPEWPHETTYGPAPAGHCFVAIGMKTEEHSFGGKPQTRTQFPLMEAAALTIHKAQGLTLARVRYDPGDREPLTSVGIFFVGLTRVKHPHHLMLVAGKHGFPNQERLTSIGNMPSLISRHNHEVELWRKFQCTCDKLRALGLQPGPAAANRAPTYRTANAKQPAKAKPTKGVATPPASPTPKHSQQQKQVVPKAPQKKAKSSGSHSGHQAIVDHHRNVLATRGMEWPVGVQGYSCPMPTWMHPCKMGGMQLRVRVVDFYSDPSIGASGQFMDYLSNLFPNPDAVFDTPHTPGCKHQIGSSCGMVAAMSVAAMRVAVPHWMTVHLGRTTDGEVIPMCNQLLRTQLQNLGASWMLYDHHVEELVQMATGTDKGGLAQFCTVGSLDQCLAKVTEDVHAHAMMPGIPMPPKWVVSNTQLSTSSGFHWFTVGYQVVWNG